ncbi:disease resistance protein Pik-2-like [Miscanthus floridulus]|uniref:disease resistance protein Pik-2-like n=1 Tax=Miscanthus floridulus TaxID=154761 RepID=UPI00345979D0
MVSTSSRRTLGSRCSGSKASWRASTPSSARYLVCHGTGSLDEQVKVWACEVREASYDIEDVLDTFLVRVDDGEPADPSRLIRAMKKMGKMFSKAKARRDISSAIEDIRKHLEEVAEMRQKYKLDEIVMSKAVTATSSIDARLTAMYKEMTQLIGVRKSSDEFMSMLMPFHPDDDAYDSIYNTGRGVDLLICEVREFLKNKRYFLIVDDVWEVKKWKRIKLVLVENNCGSKVITTTRKFDVAEEAGEVYKLKPLSNNDSMKLFYIRIFGVDPEYLDNQPDDICNKFLMKCGGIPLAIITMSSLLVGKPKNEWSEIYNSIGFGSKGNMQVEDTMTIISFSYYDLPPHLRTCLLYLSTYPEDYEIDKDSLIWKWIAEGFVHEKQGERLLELGQRYFNDLSNRSMIQAVDEWSDGRVSGGRVHDIVLDLLHKFSFEENFTAILDGNAKAISPPSNVRRFALHNITAEHVSSEAKVAQMPKVRSYTAFSCYIDNNWEHIPSFRLLRVLDVIKCSFKECCHLEHLGGLFHLRYLGIFVGSVPDGIGKLTSLE